MSLTCLLSSLFYINRYITAHSISIEIKRKRCAQRKIDRVVYVCPVQACATTGAALRVDGRVDGGVVDTIA
ncbi:hypothetical protein [Paraburkholderia sp. J67]|uniref:hypothetical protein n=1 Tax=Paraburkholderia sp. J67 TaxID=2805435 RepID=UPI002ABDD801|nr:hypothetical protein [Paraburkholderia sp. J67]